LAIGYGEGEMYVGSDAIALAPLTNRIAYLEEGDCAVITRTSVEITDRNGTIANRAIRTVQVDSTRIDKAGHKHFMAKEIAEQPGVIGAAIGHYLTPEGEINISTQNIDFSQFDRIIMVACGTASYACLTAKYWFEQIARLPVEVDVASEFRYREPPIPPRTLAVFVSQSGETADTLAALRYCEGKAARILSVVNVPESSIARESDYALPIHAGVEVGVASTKAFTCQLVVLFALVLKAARDREAITAEAFAGHISGLRGLPAIVSTALEQNDTMQEAALKLSHARDVLFLGRGQMYPLALEGALKLKEISYIHAEAYASGELKHGPIALVDEHVPVVVMAPRDALFDKTVSNMQEVMARKGKVILISDSKGQAEANEGVWFSIEMPPVPDALAPILYAIPAQLLAYHTAVAKGTDVDQPRNLAKSVTVE
ncbi:MAG: glutamine--fructose-6-phosphate transaminase (isomerizing), partial [Tateyamaria sp.]